MSRVSVKLEVEHPTIVVQLTPDGMKISLEAWQHNAPVRFLVGLDIRVQQEIHRWRARFLAQDTKMSTPTLREQDANEAQQADTTRRVA